MSREQPPAMQTLLRLASLLLMLGAVSLPQGCVVLEANRELRAIIARQEDLLRAIPPDATITTLQAERDSLEGKQLDANEQLHTDFLKLREELTSPGCSLSEDNGIFEASSRDVPANIAIVAGAVLRPANELWRCDVRVTEFEFKLAEKSGRARFVRVPLPPPGPNRDDVGLPDAPTDAELTRLAAAGASRGLLDVAEQNQQQLRERGEILSRVRDNATLKQRLWADLDMIHEATQAHLAVLTIALDATLDETRSNPLAEWFELRHGDDVHVVIGRFRVHEGSGDALLRRARSLAGLAVEVSGGPVDYTIVFRRAAADGVPVPPAKP